jgi:hypothetical protein
MEINKMPSKIVTHDFPVWRSKANFIIRVKLEDSNIDHLADSEQIWARQIGENSFEICCIPFFAYGLALGDLVSTSTLKSEKYVIDKILEKSGHVTYRLLFRDLNKWDEVVQNIKDLGCSVEKRCKKSTLVSIDASTPEVATKLESYLTDLQNSEIIKVEIAI